MPTRLPFVPASLLRLWLVSLFCVVLLGMAVLSPVATAQSFFLTPVPNAPFSGVVNVERTFVHKDGSVSEFKSTREVARDIRGRIHNELRGLVPVTSSAAPPLVRIHLYDPQSRVSTEIDVQTRTFRTTTLDHPAATEPPSVRFGAANGNAPPNQFTKQEDLGILEIDGVPAHGVRQTQTVTDEQDGKEIVIVDEYWYSEELRVNLKMKHSDPREGSSTFTVAQIVRTEPDAALFEVPDGFTRPGGKRGMRR
jgi:hypothetical protein